MKKLQFLIVLLLFIALCVNVFAQTTQYPFDVQKSGHGTKSIVFIPGFACSGDVWKETRSKYENNFTCYTLTMAGFAGVSPKADASFKNWENAIAGFIKENKIEKPVIIGHSMGGALALAIAADYPELMSKIIVVDALPCLAALMNPSFASKENNDCSAMVNQFTSISNEQFYQMQKMALGRMMTDTSKLEAVVNWGVQSDRKTYASMYCDFSNTDLREKIKTVQCPSLILLEPQFATMKPAVEEQYRNLKTVDLEYANKGLHFIMYDDTEWYFSQLNKFILSK